MVINNFLFFNIKTSLLTPECRFQHSRHIKHTQYIYPLFFFRNPIITFPDRFRQYRNNSQ